MKKNIWTIYFYSALLLLTGCSLSVPTDTTDDRSNLGLRLNFVEGTLWDVEGEQALQRTGLANAISRLEVYVIFKNDTLARETVRMEPETEELTAVLEVPAGKDRRIVVEAWNDDLGEISNEGAPTLEFRGVRKNIQIEPLLDQEVEVALYPLPIAQQRVVIIAGSGEGTAGSARNNVPISIISADSVHAIQFDLSFDSNLISPISLSPDRMFDHFEFDANLVNTSNAGLYRVLMFDQSNASLAPQSDPASLLLIEFRINQNAQTGDRSQIDFSDFIVVDKENRQLQVISVSGDFAVI